MTYFLFLGLVSLTFNPHAKFEVCTFCHSRDIEGSQNLKSRSLFNEFTDSSSDTLMVWVGTGFRHIMPTISNTQHYIFTVPSSRSCAIYFKKVLIELQLILHCDSTFQSNQIKSNLFAIVKMHNKQFIKITFHLAGQTGDSFALMSAHKN